jgi:hypothetical protein
LVWRELNQHSSGQNRQQLRHWRIIAKRLICMDEDVDIPRPKNKTPAQLEGILANLMLPVPSGNGARPRLAILRTENRKNGANPKIDGLVGNTVDINQQRERDASVLTENARIRDVAKADGGNTGALEMKSLFPFAQLRDMLAAKQSPVVAQKRHHTRIAGPQRSKPYGLTLRVRQDDFRELRAQSSFHER